MKEGFAFPKCERLRLYTDEITRGTISIGNHHAFEHTRRVPTDKDKKITWKENGPGWMSLDPTSIDARTSSFSVHIPIDNFVSRNGADTWALDLQLVSVFSESKVVPNSVLPYSLEVLADQNLVIDSIQPALARTRPNPKADTSYTTELANRVVVGNDPALLGADDDTQLNTINQTRLQLTLRDPGYAVRRDVGILVLSTLFGIAVTLLFETMLVLSVRQSLKLQSQKETEEGQNNKATAEES